MGQYDRIPSPFGGPGRYTNPGMVAAIRTYCAIKGISLSAFYMIQGSFNTTVAASAGTHDRADCIDTAASVDERVLKMIGINAQQRTTAQGFDPHTHMMRMYSTAMAWLAQAQDEAYRLRKSNGLGNLSTTDTSWCPRYRGVKHLSGPTTRKYKATKTTWGYSQPGCHSDDDADLHVKTRATGYILSNIAGRVRCNGSEYFVTNGGTFYNAANFEAYVEPAPAPAPSYTNYYVIGPFALGHASPSATSRRVEAPRPWGTLTPIYKTTTVNGATWGWYEPSGSEGRWYLMANLSKTKPTTRIEKIGTITVGEYNTAAQAKGHAGTYPTRAPLSAQQMVAGGADVIGAVEYGSASARHANGKTYLQISDDARKAASGGNLVRIPHGEDWRHLLRRLDTTEYVADSGRSWTLPTRVDANGTQVVAAAILKKGVDMKLGHAVTHFDVNSTAAQLKAQAVETLQTVDAWRREVGIRPWNLTFTLDENDTGDTVAGVFASWGFVSASTQPGAVGGQYRTTNSWVNQSTVGPQRDSTFVWEGSAEGWQQWLDAVASDHNYNQAIRAIYGTP